MGWTRYCQARATAAALVASVLPFALGCSSVNRIDDADADADADGDADSQADSGSDASDASSDSGGGDGACGLGPTEDVDVLVVWDNAGVGSELQEAFVGALAALEAELPGEVSLRVGAVTTDLGAGEFPNVMCDEAGESGRLRECTLTGERFHTGKGDGLVAFLSCVLPESDTGCGFEMVLESARLALTDQAAAGMPNEGFLRPGSVVVVLVVGNEDDCSTSDHSLFDPDADLGPLNTRCALHQERLNAVASCVAALRALRPGCPERVLAGGVIGVPRDWDGSLDLPALVPRPSEDPARLVRLCDEGVDFWADPAPRLALFAASLESSSFVASSCYPDEFPEALAALGRRLATLASR